MKILAIIPARGGSKRIERKNVKEFCGMPIIGYSIKAALRSECFEEVMVSTDDEEIASVARSFGATVPFMRSAETANDYATTADVIEEVLDCYERQGRKFDAIACIYATAPFVTARRLRAATRILEEGRAEAAFTCVEYSYPIQRSLRVDAEGKVSMKFPEYAKSRSQDLEPSYHDAGQFYFSTVSAFRACGSLWGPDTVPIVLPELEVQDLDTPTDWALAELKYTLTLFPERFEADGYSFISYPVASKEMHRRVLAERNDPELRQLMVHTGAISEAEHFRFVDGLKGQRKKQYYVVTDASGDLIASVNAEWINEDQMERGIWVAKAYRRHGHAERILNAFYDFLKKDRGVKSIFTRVKTDNMPSLKLEGKLRSTETGGDGEYLFFEKPL